MPRPAAFSSAGDHPHHACPGSSVPYLEPSSEATRLAHCALAALEGFGVSPNPDHFAVWYEYLAGLRPDLVRAVEILRSNGRPIDDAVLDDLRRAFLTTARVEPTLRETGWRMGETLRHISEIVQTAEREVAGFGRTLETAAGTIPARGTDLAGLIRELLGEVGRMVASNEQVSTRLADSGNRVAALEKALEVARREATTDALTGLANRRHFDIRLHAAAGAAMNSGEPLSLLIVDIDHFKQFNDSWGHQTGDAVLRLVAATLHRTVRGGDCPARFGGEDFAVILPATVPEAAMAVGENIRHAFEKAELVAREGRRRIGGITVSVGGATYVPGEKLAGLVARADAALYQAKQGGRNRVRFG